MKKIIDIRRLISFIITTLLLIYFYIKTPNGKIILIPFLICSISMLLQSVFIIMNKDKYVKLFNKMFIISFFTFWFGFLIYWCYINFINKEYLSILFSIPFYISGIYISRKKLSKDR